jgi:dihydropteroate synthase
MLNTEPPVLQRLLPLLGRRTLIMGVLNVTPDSFSDGGRYAGPDAAIAQARRMAAEGADIVDVGGESTRPGAAPVSAEEELRRTLPVIERIAAELPGLVISLDTTKAAVARAGIAVGAHLINDVSAGTLDPDMLTVIAELGVPAVLMHLPVVPREMGWSRAGGGMDASADAVEVVAAFLRERIGAADAAGVRRENLIVDPGFGFGKTVAQNLDLVRRLSVLRDRVGRDIPVLLGTSRKSTLGQVLGPDADRDDPDRVAGTAATVAIGIANGADIVRVHDVAFMARVARISDAIGRYPRGS